MQNRQARRGAEGAGVGVSPVQAHLYLLSHEGPERSWPAVRGICSWHLLFSVEWTAARLSRLGTA